MKERYDICIIGGGILGCMAARELSRYQISTILLEEKEDVCMGITKANCAVVYAGYDHKSNTLKSEMCVRGNVQMERLCEDLDVPFIRRGSIMAGFGPKSEKVLQKKLEQGKRNQVPGLELLTGREVLALEPCMNDSVTMGLLAKTTATVNPWELGIAAYENAVENGLEVSFSCKVSGIQKEDLGYIIETTNRKNGSISYLKVKGILNCAGMFADHIRSMVLSPRYVIRPSKSSFLVFSKFLEQKPGHILFCESEEKGKGITLVPTTDGSLLIEGSQEEALSRTDTTTQKLSLELLFEETKRILPGLDQRELIHSFAGIRPNPWEIGEDRSIPEFVIDSSEECPGFISLIGIKTPGLTCSQELARHVTGMLFSGMGITPQVRSDFRSKRRTYRKKAVSRNQGRIICHCNMVKEEEIREAIRCGAATWEGIKHRCFTGMGHCQGSRCKTKVLNILEDELGRRS